MASPWSSPAVEAILALAAERVGAGDPRGALLVGYVLERECGAAYARAVLDAVAAGTPWDAFGFLGPVPAGDAAARGGAAPGRDTAAAESTAAAGPGGAQGAGASEAEPRSPAAGRTAESGVGGEPGPGTAASGTTPRSDTPGGHGRRRARPSAGGEPGPGTPRRAYVTVREVAERYDVSLQTVYRWLAAGRIQTERRPGGSYRIPAAQFRDGGAATVGDGAGAPAP